MKTELLGTIRLDGGPLLVIDPCYLPELKDGVFVDGIPAGEYPVWAYVNDFGKWGERTTELTLEISPERAERQIEVGVAGVDSGQMAMLAASLVPDWGGETEIDMSNVREVVAAGGEHPVNAAARTNRGQFNYWGACDCTLGEGHGGTIDTRMAISSTGYGDGSYPVLVRTIGLTRIVSVSVIFVDPDES